MGKKLSESNDSGARVIKPLAWKWGIRESVKDFLAEYNIKGIEFTNEGWFYLNDSQAMYFDSIKKDFPTPYVEASSQEDYNEYYKRLLMKKKYESDSADVCRRYEQERSASEVPKAGQSVVFMVQCKDVFNYFKRA